MFPSTTNTTKKINASEDTKENEAISKEDKGKNTRTTELNRDEGTFRERFRNSGVNAVINDNHNNKALSQPPLPASLNKQISNSSGSARPPKPVPFGSMPAAGSVSRSSSNNFEEKKCSDRDESVSSSCSRSALRQQISARRSSLTPRERLYLEHLATHGDEASLSSAREKLSDTSLFFDDPNIIKKDLYQEEGSPRLDSGDWGSDIVVDGGPGATSDVSTNIPSEIGTPGMVTIENLPLTLDSGTKTTRTMPQRQSFPSDLRRPEVSVGGSSKNVMEHYELRKNSVFHELMWKAHERGLRLSKDGSRNNAARRASSISRSRSITKQQIVRSSSILSSSTQELLLEGGPTNRLGEDQIFRSGKNNSRRSWSAGIGGVQQFQANRTKSVGAVQQQSITELHRLRLHRSASEDTRRKSVTFHPHAKNEDNDTPPALPIPETITSKSSDEDVPGVLPPPPPRPQDMMDRVKSDSTIDTIPSIRRGHPVRSDSISSIPSIHHGHPIRSDSISSIPSIHHGHPIRSNSISSIPSIHHGHPIRSDSLSSIPLSIVSARPSPAIRSDSISSIPSIRHGRPIRSDSVASFIAAGSPASITTAGDSFFPSGEDVIKEVDSKNSDASSSNASPSVPTPPPAWESPAPLAQSEIEGVQKGQLVYPSSTTSEQTSLAKSSNTKSDSLTLDKAVLLRRASKNKYEGEGIEVSDLDKEIASSSLSLRNGSIVVKDTLDKAREYQSMLSGLSESDGRGSIVGLFLDGSSSSFDETKSYGRQEIFRDTRRQSIRIINARNNSSGSYSFYIGNSAEDLTNKEISSVQEVRGCLDEMDASWDMESDDGYGGYRVDYAWDVLRDEYAVGYGAYGQLPFRIFGTSANDKASQPHVLSPPLMESLQSFLPSNISEDNFWMKYSLVRDGASLHTLLQSVRGSQYTILALETSEGEVFGTFTSETWRKNWNYYGNGESFLWKMRKSRKTESHSIIDQAHLESELEVYPWTGENNCFQLCTHDRIAIGGGFLEHNDNNNNNDDEDDVIDEDSNNEDEKDNEHKYGFGLAIDGDDLLQGTSSPCMTFANPQLASSETFEIMNLEVWTFTPCMTEEDAEKMELGKLFLQAELSP